MQCVLVLNAVRFGAKCLAFWCKTQGKMVLNAVQNAAKCEPKKYKNTLQWNKYNPLEPLNTWLKGAKWPSKSGVLGVKSA